MSAWRDLGSSYITLQNPGLVINIRHTEGTAVTNSLINIHPHQNHRHLIISDQGVHSIYCKTQYLNSCFFSPNPVAVE